MAVLAEPLTLGEETITRNAWSTGKVIALCSMVIGLVFAALFVPLANGDAQDLVAEDPAISMLGANIASPSSPVMCSNLPKLSVPAIEEGLRKHGISPTPISRLALTQLAATRDVSMRAEVQKQYESLDAKTKAELQKLKRDLMVRAEGAVEAIQGNPTPDSLINTLKKEDYAGATGPLGYWDPLNFGEFFGGEYGLWGMRIAELKHGRVCMLAAAGFAFGEKFHPLLSDEGGFVSAVSSHFTEDMRLKFWPGIWFLLGPLDLVTSIGQSPDKLPGDLGYDPLGLKPKDPKELLVLQNKELNNGRLAMFAIMGMIAQEMVTGKRIF